MKKSYFILLGCFFIFHSYIANAQETATPPTGSDSSSNQIKNVTTTTRTGKVKGIVTDEKQQPVLGAIVVYDENAGGTTTDIDGKYELTLPVGFHVIQYRFIGYDTTSIRTKVSESKELTQNVEMTKTSVELGLTTVTGSKYNQKFGTNPVTIEVLKPEFIENSNNTNLNTALNKVTGVDMVGEQVNIRGGAGYASGAASKVLMLMDGLPLLTPDDATIEFGSLPMENVEQVEIIKGASSALYGSSALNGIINLITANPKAKPYTKVTLFYGLYENPFKGKKKQIYWDKKRPMFGGASFSHRQRYKNLDVVIGGSYYQDKSYLADNETKRARLNMKFRYHPEKVPGLSLGLNANFASNSGGYFFLWKYWKQSNADSIGIPGYTAKDSLAYVPSESGTFRTTPINLDPFVIYFDKHNNQHSFKGRWYYVPSLNSGGQSSFSSLYYGEYNFITDLKKLGLNIVTGLVGSYTNVKSETFGTRKGENGALFVQLDKKFFNRLTISIGERNEIIHLDTLKPVVVPIVRAGINYQATEGTFIRASFGQGYRYPSIAEKYVTTVRSGINVIPNPDVKAESGWSAELGVKQALKVGKSWLAFVDLAGFVTQYQNMIEFNAVLDSDGKTVYQANNVTNARISGVEVSGFGQGKIMGYPLNFMLGYTYLIPIDLDWTDSSALPSNTLKYRFKHSAKADLETTIKHVIIGATATYTSFMENIDPYISGPNLNGIEAFRNAHHGGNFVLDGRVGYSLSDETRISFIAKNVLNSQYSLRPGYMEAPRNYTVQLSYQF